MLIFFGNCVRPLTASGATIRRRVFGSEPLARRRFLNRAGLAAPTLWAAPPPLPRHPQCRRRMPASRRWYSKTDTRFVSNPRRLAPMVSRCSPSYDGKAILWDAQAGGRFVFSGYLGSIFRGGGSRSDAPGANVRGFSNRRYLGRAYWGTDPDIRRAYGVWPVVGGIQPRRAGLFTGTQDGALCLGRAEWRENSDRRRKWGVSSVAFSADGRRLLTCSGAFGDNTATISDAETGNHSQVLTALETERSNVSRHERRFASRGWWLDEP